MIIHELTTNGGVTVSFHESKKEVEAEIEFRRENGDDREFETITHSFKPTKAGIIRLLHIFSEME